jgi:hypothetical protein
MTIIIRDAYRILGDHSALAPPLPIPNRTVKRRSADDSADLPCESRSSPRPYKYKCPEGSSLRAFVFVEKTNPSQRWRGVLFLQASVHRSRRVRVLTKRAAQRVALLNLGHPTDDPLEEQGQNRRRWATARARAHGCSLVRVSQHAFPCASACASACSRVADSRPIASARACTCMPVSLRALGRACTSASQRSGARLCIQVQSRAPAGFCMCAQQDRLQPCARCTHAHTRLCIRSQHPLKTISTRCRDTHGRRLRVIYKG